MIAVQVHGYSAMFKISDRPLVQSFFKSRTLVSFMITARAVVSLMDRGVHQLSRNLYEFVKAFNGLDFYLLNHE